MSAISNDFESIDRLFKPRSVAVVGVSDKPGNQGKFLIEAMTRCGFKGKIYAINPREEVKGWESYKKVSDVPGPVDHLVVSVPATAVASVIADAGEKGVRSASMFTSGFAEWGTEEGVRLQKELIEVGKASGVRLIGPNCMGFYCPSSGLSFRPDMPMLDGEVGFISQSGGVCITGIYMTADRGVGISKAISYGNETDIGAPELLDYMADDPTTRIIMLYIEGTNRGRYLFEAMKRAASKKPTYVLKGGSTATGLRAVSSHTGAMAGSGGMWESMIHQAGAIMVRDLDELVDAAQITSKMQKPAGRRVGLLTISGGFGVYATDLIEKAGFSMPEYSQVAQDAIGQIIRNPGTSLKNPLDMAAQFFQPRHYPALIAALNLEQGVDFFVTLLAVDYLTFRGEGGEKWAIKLTDKFLSALKDLKKPNAFVFFQTGMNETRLKLERQIIDAGYPLFPTVERAMDAIDRYIRAGGII